MSDAVLVERGGQRTALSRQSALTFLMLMAWATLRPAWQVVDRSYKAADRRDLKTVETAAKVYRALPAVPPGAPHPIPKRIWMVWQQGWEHAPDLVRRCAQSWQEQNAGWEVVLLDEKTLPRHCAGLESISPELTRPARADMVRTMLLAEHGGIWADATCFCARPLDAWIPYAAQSGFFMFAHPRPYRIVEAWFIAAAKDSPVMAGMLDLCLQYFGYFKKPHHYFWLVYLIEHLFRIDPASRRIWDATPKLTALGPDGIEPHVLVRPPPQVILDIIEEACIPLHKLKHVWRSDDITGTALERLTGLHALGVPPS
jgi:hypothetical protein